MALEEILPLPRATSSGLKFCLFSALMVFLELCIYMELGMNLFNRGVSDLKLPCDTILCNKAPWLPSNSVRQRLLKL